MADVSEHWRATHKLYDDAGVERCDVMHENGAYMTRRAYCEFGYGWEVVRDFELKAWQWTAKPI